MTEDEAKTKWCPHIRPNKGDFEIAPYAGSWCIGAECMAWRWLPFNALDPLYIEAIKKCEDEGMKPPQAAKHVNANRADFNLPTEPFEGYCGLAGKP